MQSSWRLVGAWVVLLIALAAAFYRNFVEMWVRWFPAWRHANQGLYDRLVGGESYYTHGPLVPLVSLLIVFLLIRKTRIGVRPRPAAGGLVLGAALLIHLAGCLARVNFVSGFALILALMGLVLMLWGAEALRRLWFPLAFLAFMVPLPEVSISQINFRLKMQAADWGVTAANALGVLAERSGNRVYLEGDKTLVIANVCNGLRTLISLLAFGALYAYVCRLRGPWRLGLFAMTVPVAVLSNSVRIVALIVVADVWDVATATGFFHDASGLLIYGIAFVLMFSLERLVLWARAATGRPAKVLPLFHDVRRGEGDERQWERLVAAVGARRGMIAAAIVVLAAAGAWWLNRSIPSVWNQDLARRALPQELLVAGQEMRGRDMVMDDKTLDILETRDYLFRRYEAAALPPIDVCVIFSRDNRKGTHPPDVCLEGGGEGIVGKGEVVVAGIAGRGGLACREIIIQSGPAQQYFLYTYKCGRKYTPSFWSQQFTIFTNGLLNRNASGALIRVSTPVTSGLADARQRAQQMLVTTIPHWDRGLP